MEEKSIISITTLCTRYNITEKFIYSLREFELLETVQQEGEEFIQVSQLQWIEKMIRLHFELDINMEGLDAIRTLLQQVWKLQQENQELKDKLDFYE